MRVQIGAFMLAAAAIAFAVDDGGLAVASEPLPMAETCATAKDVASNPNACLKASAKVKESGIIKSYRELSELTVTNSSSFKIGSIAGEVTWSNADGTTVGTVVFSTTGVVPAGGATVFSQKDKSLTTTKLETNAPSYTIKFTSVTVLE